MNKRVIILTATFAFYILQNMYFGFNMRALSPAEGFCDTTVIFGMALAFLWNDKK